MVLVGRFSVIFFAKISLGIQIVGKFLSVCVNHTSLDRRKDTRRQKPKQSFQTKIMKSRIHCHQQNTYEMKAEFLTFQSTYDSLHTNIHEPRNINFRRRGKFDGTTVFSEIQTSVALQRLFFSFQLF